MKADKLIISKEEIDIEFSGITLLTAEEAEKLPMELRDIGEDWVLRSPGYNALKVCTVCSDGCIDTSGGDSYYETNETVLGESCADYDGVGYDYASVGVRPALVISYSKGLADNDKVVLPQKPNLKWTIFNGKAICDEVITRCPFRTIDHLSEDKTEFFLTDGTRHPIEELNKYEYSDVKAVIEGWEKSLGLTYEKHAEKGRAIDRADYQEIVEDVAEIFEDFCRQRNIAGLSSTGGGFDKSAREECWKDGSMYEFAAYNTRNNLKIHVNGEPFTWSYDTASKIAEGSIDMFKHGQQDGDNWRIDCDREILKGRIIKKFNEWGIVHLKDISPVLDVFDGHRNKLNQRRSLQDQNAA